MNYDFDFAPVFARWPDLLSGAWVTLQLSFGAMAIGLVVAVLGVWGRTAGPKPLQWLIAAYVEIIRNTPFIVQIFFIFFGLPSLGIRFSPNAAALVALVINVTAYAIEILRAGIEAIPKGQTEAGTALAMSRLQIFRHVVFMPALRTVYPALTSQFIFLFLSTSVVSVISANDLTATGNDINAQTFASFEIYLVITVIYLVMSLGFSALFATIHRIAFSYPLSR